MNILTKALMLAMAFFVLQTGNAQEVPFTTIYLPHVEVMDSNLCQIMHEVSLRVHDCSLIREVQCHIIVSTRRGSSGIDYIDFVLTPFNESDLRLFAEIWGYSKWSITDYQDISFLFTFNDTRTFKVIGYDSIVLSPYSGINYLYFDINNRITHDIHSVETYTKQDLLCVQNMSCVDISTMSPIRWNNNTVVYIPKGYEEDFKNAIKEKGEMRMGLQSIRAE